MRYVALLRGINVGGNNKIAMGDLRALLASLEYDDVSTYINSGNAVFTSSSEDAASLERDIERQITEQLGLKITVLVRMAGEITSVAENNPLLDAETAPNLLHVTFLSAPPSKEQLAAIDPRQYLPDEFRLGDRAIYLRFPNGVAGAKLTYNFWEKQLGVRATTRNWNTVLKLATMVTST